ncbi:hypothetical protein XENOCAPTIV_025368, partial [Xenoophorus captivus]
PEVTRVLLRSVGPSRYYQLPFLEEKQFSILLTVECFSLQGYIILSSFGWNYLLAVDYLPFGAEWRSRASGISR